MHAAPGLCLLGVGAPRHSWRMLQEHCLQGKGALRDNLQMFSGPSDWKRDSKLCPPIHHSDKVVKRHAECLLVDPYYF